MVWGTGKMRFVCVTMLIKRKASIIDCSTAARSSKGLPDPRPGPQDDRHLGARCSKSELTLSTLHLYYTILYSTMKRDHVPIHSRVPYLLIPTIRSKHLYIMPDRFTRSG